MRVYAISANTLVHEGLSSLIGDTDITFVDRATLQMVEDFG